MAAADDQNLTIDIGKDGDLQGFSRAARRRLAASSGRYRLLPSPAGLMIWERTDGTAPPSGKKLPAVALAGEIGGPGGLVDVLNFIHFNQWDGGLWIVSQGVRKALFFEKGQLLSAQSSQVEDRLGHILVRVGKLTAEQLAGCARDVTTARRLGTLLVERGLVTTHDLYRALQSQAEEIFHSTLLLRTGAFYFTRSLEETLPSRLHLDTQSLLLESLKRIDEMAYFRSKLPSPEVVLGRRPGQLPELEGSALLVFQLVDDRRTLGEIASESRLGEFETTKAAFELLQRGLVSVRAAAAMVREAPPRRLPTSSGIELIDAYNRGLRRLQMLLVAKQRPALLAEGVVSFIAGSARYATIMEGVKLEDDGTLSAAQLVENLTRLPVGEGMAHLREALAELLLFVLFLAHDDIDPVDEQAIHEQVVRAVERL